MIHTGHDTHKNYINKDTQYYNFFLLCAYFTLLVNTTQAALRSKETHYQPHRQEVTLTGQNLHCCIGIPTTLVQLSCFLGVEILKMCGQIDMYMEAYICMY